MNAAKPSARESFLLRAVLTRAISIAILLILSKVILRIALDKPIDFSTGLIESLFLALVFGTLAGLLQWEEFRAKEKSDSKPASPHP